MTALDDALSFLGADLHVEHPLGPATTYRVGGRAQRHVDVSSAEQLASIAGAVAGLRRRGEDVPVLVLGRGSNLLVADAGFPGLALSLGEAFAGIEVRPPDGPDGSVVVRAGGAVSLPVLARRTVAAGLTGFEWAVGVPGSVGGAVRMNAGGHGSDTAASLVGVRVVDLGTGEDVEVDVGDLHLGYRSSRLRDEQVVVRADLRLRPGPVDRGERELAAIVRWRRANQPGGQNAGSVFTNPPGGSAGALIEEAGCKGLRVGTASVSEKHANFFQSDADGAADDVFALMVDVAARVLRRSGVRMHPETCLVGFQDFDAALDAALAGPGGESDRPSSPGSTP